MTPTGKILKDNPNSSSGCYGTYYYLTSGRGIKVLQGGFSTKELAKESDNYTLAVAEKRFLDLLTSRGSTFTPKCYGIVIFKHHEYFRVGLVLQDLGQTKLIDLKKNKVINETRYHKVMNLFEKKIQFLGVLHKDVHGENVMYHNRKFWLIDFTPSLIREYNVFRGHRM